jgi:hypothetical protein
VVAVRQAWFHGIRAISIAMPQVSVIPANTSPQPTKPARPAPIACQLIGASGPKPASAADGDERAGGDPHLPFERHHRAAAHHRHPGGLAGGRSPCDADHVLEARGEHLLAGLLTAATRLADEVGGPAAAEGRHGLRVEPVERDVVGEIDVHFAELGRRADIDEGDFFPFAAQVGELRGRNGGDHGNSLRGVRKGTGMGMCRDLAIRCRQG